MCSPPIVANNEPNDFSRRTNPTREQQERHDVDFVQVQRTGHKKARKDVIQIQKYHGISEREMKSHFY